MASKSYIVTAAVVIAKNDDGSDRYVYRGGAVPDGQSQAWLDQHLGEDMIAEPKAAEAQIAEELAQPGISVDDKPAVRPSK